MRDSRSAGDRALDETLEETFPASDALANTVETGTQKQLQCLNSSVSAHVRAVTHRSSLPMVALRVRRHAMSGCRDPVNGRCSRFYRTDGGGIELHGDEKMRQRHS